MWTQKAISDWADDTFGDLEGWSGLVDKARDELGELQDAVDDLEDNENPYDYPELADKMLEEAADIMIVLMRIFEYHGQDYQKVIHDKMNVNIKRKWTKFGNGNGQHDDGAQ